MLNKSATVTVVECPEGLSVQVSEPGSPTGVAVVRVTADSAALRDGRAQVGRIKLAVEVDGRKHETEIAVVRHPEGGE